MGWFFNKKSKIEESPKPVPCRHKWKDFPWYYEATYESSYKTLHAQIIEPYVCIHCKERKNVILRDFTTSCSYKEADELMDEWQKNYKDHLMDRALVEDMISDMQLVDREYLAIAESLAHPATSGLETEMNKLLTALKNQPLEKSKKN